MASRKMDYTMILIDFFEKNQFLWNSKDPLFQNKDMKATAINTIAMQLEVTSDDIESHWRSLRSGFGRELKKVQNSQKSGPDGSDNAYKPKWVYYSKLLFLKDVIQSRQSYSSNMATRYPPRHETVGLQQPESYAIKYEETNWTEDSAATTESFHSIFPNRDAEYPSRRSLSPTELDIQPASSVSPPPCDSPNHRINNSAVLSPVTTIYSPVPSHSACGANKRRKNHTAKEYDLFDAAVNQIANVRQNRATSAFGQYVTTVLDELGRETQIKTMNKISTILCEAQLSNL